MNPDMEKSQSQTTSLAGNELWGGTPDSYTGVTRHEENQRKRTPVRERLIERVVERSNMLRAYRKVKSNSGSAGVDGVSIEEYAAQVEESWPKVKEELLNGTYRPKPVKGVEIPKPNGGIRLLGIPTVMDRVIQQALLQILSPIFESGFSTSSYGFRPGKSAHQAVKTAQEFQKEGRRVVVDIDLAKFFDEVDHDVLMARVRRKVKEKEILKLIGAFLKAGIMVNGRLEARPKGTPQGGNLSPLLANIMLDDLDKLLEKRGHKFCRYADDCNIYVHSKRAGHRVMESLSRFVERILKLKVNREKSAVAHPCRRKFLGYSFMPGKHPKLRVSESAQTKLKEKIRSLFGQSNGRNLHRFIREGLNPVIKGWINYFIHAEVSTFADEIDGWIRRKLRKIMWQNWKNPWTRRRELIKAGVPEYNAVRTAFNQKGPWYNSDNPALKFAFKKNFFDHMGLKSMVDELYLYRKFVSGTAVCGPACTVV